MKSSKQSFLWGLLGGLFLILVFGMAAPRQVIGAPPAQITVTPRPTVNPLTPTPSPEIGGFDAVKRKIDLAMVVDKTQARPGDTLKYQVQVSNVAGQKATNVWLTCDLPDQLEITTYSTTRGLVHRYGQRLSIEMGLFEPSYESFWVEIEGRIKADVVPGTRLVHHASLTSDQAGGGESTVTTRYDTEVETVVLDGQTVAVEKTALPSTGHGRMPFWTVPLLAVMIVLVALLESRTRARLSG